MEDNKNARKKIDNNKIHWKKRIDNCTQRTNKNNLKMFIIIKIAVIGTGICSICEIFHIDLLCPISDVQCMYEWHPSNNKCNSIIIQFCEGNKLRIARRRKAFKQRGSLTKEN